MGDSSTVELRILTPSILVRIQVPQPIKSIACESVSQKISGMSLWCRRLTRPQSPTRRPLPSDRPVGRLAAPEEIAASPAFAPLTVDLGSLTAPTPSVNGSCKRVVVYVTSATLLKRAKFPFNSAIFGYSATRAPKLSH